MSKIDDLIAEVVALETHCEAGGLPLSKAWQDLQTEIAKLRHDAGCWQEFVSEAGLTDVEKRARNLIKLAEVRGLVVRIETRPLQPLAMGNYEMVASVQERRAPAVPYDQLAEKRICIHCRAAPRPLRDCCPASTEDTHFPCYVKGDAP